MELSLPRSELKSFVLSQLDHFYPDGKGLIECQGGGVFSKAFDLALERLEYCFSYIRIQGYSTADGNPFFYHLNSDQYSQFLYYLSNSLWKLNGSQNICDKLILLNKALHGCWFSYKNNLPNIFLLVHPVGTVIGNVNYSDYLVVYQNVTVNTIRSNIGGISVTYDQTFGKGLLLTAGAKIIGRESIGDWVTIGVNSCVYKQEIPSNSIVYRDKTGAIFIKKYDTKKLLENYFYF